MTNKVEVAQALLERTNELTKKVEETYKYITLAK